MPMSNYAYSAVMLALRTGPLPQLYLGLVGPHSVDVVQRAFQGRLQFRRKRTVVREVSWPGYERQPYDALGISSMEWECGGESTITYIVAFDAPRRGRRYFRYGVHQGQMSLDKGSKLSVETAPIRLLV